MIRQLTDPPAEIPDQPTIWTGSCFSTINGDATSTSSGLWTCAGYDWWSESGQLVKEQQ